MKAIAALAAVLFLGCLIGVTGSRFLYGKRMNVQPYERSNDVLPLSPHGEQHLLEQIGMSPEQKVQFEDIMKESREELDVLSREQQSKINAVIAEANKKIHSILNDEQKTKLEMSLKDVNKRREHGSRGGRGSGSPSPPPKNKRK